MFTRYRSQLKKMYNILLNSFSSVVTILKKEKKNMNLFRTK